MQTGRTGKRNSRQKKGCSDGIQGDGGSWDLPAAAWAGAAFFAEN